MGKFESEPSDASHRHILEIQCVLPVGDEGAELGGAVGDVDGGGVDACRVRAGT